MINYHKIKLDLFYVRKAFFEYHRGFKYLYYRYYFAKKILKRKMPLEKPINHQDLSIHILTCHRDLIMTLWSLGSYYLNANIFGQLYIHNDGSLTSEDQQILKKYFPSSIIFNSENFLEKYGPELEKFPVLYDFRKNYKNFSFKKIIDPFFISSKKIHLILDSDILWFQQPKEIEEEFMKDGQNSLMQNNFTPIYVTFRDGSRINENFAFFNAGIILYSKDNFFPDKLSDFLSRLDITIKSNLHFVDQLGHAYCLNNLISLPKDNYIIKNGVNETTVAKHYTGPRRPQYFIEGLQILKKYGLF